MLKRLWEWMFRQMATYSLYLRREDSVHIMKRHFPQSLGVMRIKMGEDRNQRSWEWARMTLHGTFQDVSSSRPWLNLGLLKYMKLVISTSRSQKWDLFSIMPRMVLCLLQTRWFWLQEDPTREKEEVTLRSYTGKLHVACFHLMTLHT